MKKLVVFLFLCVSMFFSVPLPAMAGDVDLLIKKLVEKKILTQEEAKELIGEIQKESAKAKEKADPAARPKWLNKMKVRGDLRLRFEDKDLETRTKTETKRGRVRLRVGMENEVNDKVNVGFGLATGTSGWDSARSTDQTLGDNFGSKEIVIDYAYAKYSPGEYFSVTGGKFENPLFNPGDLLWDTDIRPEGVAAKFKANLAPGLDMSFIPAFFYLEDMGGSDDPNMWILEPGISWKITDDVRLKAAATYYEFSKLKGTAAFPDSEGTNTFVGGTYRYDYDSFAFAADLGFSNLGIIPYLAVFGQYIENTDPGDDNSGHLLGIKFGHKEVRNFGQWQFKYMYRRLEKDAWLDSFPDASVLGGDTDVKSSEFLFKFGIAEKVTLGLDYYNSERLGVNMEENVLQLDVDYKF